VHLVGFTKKYIMMHGPTNVKIEFIFYFTYVSFLQYFTRVNELKIRHQKSWCSVISHIRAVSCMSYVTGL
jgi:hypothetical protein